MRLMANANGERWKIGEWIKGLNYLFGKPGILRRCAPAYFRFYRDKFHPWHYDNRHVIDEWKRSTS
jgi:predicted metal-dependent hydrolase